MNRKKADNVTDKIKTSFAGLQRLPWLPQLTPLLAGQAWETLHRRSGITMLDYGTVRVLTGKRNAPRHITTRLPLYPNKDDTPSVLTEILPRDYQRHYQDMGLRFCTPGETRDPAVIDCLQEAVHLLRHIPTLQTTVATLVKICHVLKSVDDDYDVSHSDPRIPFSIFVSVPRKRRPNDTLRVIESIVHEAMHLQLTLVERVLPLVRRPGSTWFSPWRNTCRSPQGVLHALYVFRVIDRFFERLQALSILPGAAAAYMDFRREEILRQVDEIRTFEACSALTTWGSDLARRLIIA